MARPPKRALIASPRRVMSCAPLDGQEAESQMAKHADLIYDVGFHHGEDTAVYLRKGFRVVAFEAHPLLTEKGRV